MRSCLTLYVFLHVFKELYIRTAIIAIGWYTVTNLLTYGADT